MDHARRDRPYITFDSARARQVLATLRRHAKRPIWRMGGDSLANRQLTVPPWPRNSLITYLLISNSLIFCANRIVKLVWALHMVVTHLPQIEQNASAAIKFSPLW